MEDEKIKEGIERFIGKERMMTNELRSRILLNTQNGRKPKRGAFMNFLRPVMSIAILLIVFGGMYYLITDDKDEGKTAASDEDNELLEKTLAENKELQEIIEAMNSDDINAAIPLLQEKEDEIAKLREQVEALSKSNTDKNQLPNSSLYELKEINYSGNEKDIIAELVQYNEVIPYEGVLGGTMTLRAEGAKVLSHEWVYFPFDDGHVVGHLLLKFHFKDGKPVPLEVLDAYEDGQGFD